MTEIRIILHFHKQFVIVREKSTSSELPSRPVVVAVKLVVLQLVQLTCRYDFDDMYLFVFTSLSSFSVFRNSVTPPMSLEFMNNASP